MNELVVLPHLGNNSDDSIVNAQIAIVSRFVAFVCHEFKSGYLCENVQRKNTSMYMVWR